MKRLSLCLVALLSACDQDTYDVPEPAPPRPMGQVAVEDCGTPPATTSDGIPPAPAWTTIDGLGVVVVFHPADWDRHARYLQRVASWEWCVAHHE